MNSTNLKKIRITCDAATTMPVDDLEAFQGKLKSISEAEFEKLKSAILKYGFSFPVFIWKKNILDGHQRVQAVKRLIDDGYELEGGMLPVVLIEAKDRKEAAEKLLLINSRYAKIDQSGFDIFIEDFDIDIADMGQFLDIPEVDFSFGDESFEGKTDPDDVPEVEETPVTQMGDVWILGEHRLKCGDSTKIDDVEDLMDGQKTDLIFTSPPYDNQRTYNLDEEIDWPALMEGVFGNLICTDDCQVLVNLGLIHKDNEVHCYWQPFIDFMRKSEWRFFGWYVWDKLESIPGDFKGRLNTRHEWIFHFNKKSPAKLKKIIECKSFGQKVHGTGFRKSDGTLIGKMNTDGKAYNKFKTIESVITNSPYKHNANLSLEHPAIFPIGLSEQIVKTFQNTLIYEPFSGSGTTIIAAQQTGRKCFAMEISPQYVQVALERWSNFTGKDPIREYDGVTFSSLKRNKD